MTNNHISEKKQSSEDTNDSSENRILFLSSMNSEIETLYDTAANKSKKSRPEREKLCVLLPKVNYKVIKLEEEKARLPVLPAKSFNFKMLSEVQFE